MRIPLRFQITEFDCGTVTIQNAISYLYDRKDIPAEIIRAISLYTLDCYDSKGNLGSGGTSKEAIEMLTHWITDYTNSHNFQIEAKHYMNKAVTLEVIKETVEKKGCIVLKTYLEEGHYVLVTNIDKDFAYIWDPYYLDGEYYDKDNDVKIDFNNPFSYNRIVKMERFISNEEKDFALGPIKKRECLCFTRK